MVVQTHWRERQVYGRDKPAYTQSQDDYSSKQEDDFKWSKFMPKLLGISALTLALSLMTWGCTSYIRTIIDNRTRNNNLEYVLPDTGNTKTYLVEGQPATVTKEVEEHWFHSHTRISISYRNVIFLTNPDNNSMISALQIQTGSHSVPKGPVTDFIPRDKIKDYERWERDYEELLKKIGEAKLNTERCARSDLEGKL